MKKKKKPNPFVSPFDPLGSYTGNTLEGSQETEDITQDVDDL